MEGLRKSDGMNPEIKKHYKKIWDLIKAEEPTLLGKISWDFLAQS